MTTKKPTVLVADDDPRLLKLIQRNLELANYRVLTVADGPSVLKQAESEERKDRLAESPERFAWRYCDYRLQAHRPVFSAPAKDPSGIVNDKHQAFIKP